MPEMVLFWGRAPYLKCISFLDRELPIIYKYMVHLMFTRYVCV